jgi:mono/diheme cytochrome c family protein
MILNIYKENETMKKMLFLSGLLLLLAVFLTACGGGQAAPTTAPVATEVSAAPDAPTATEAPTTAPVVTGDSIRGGKLYDIWFEELGVDAPTDVNPLWDTSTSASETTAEDSYRCGVCHGFDYKGDQGFPGIADAAGKDPNEIIAMLNGTKNPNHDFSQYLSDQDLADLALFVSNEQINVTTIVASDNTAVNGNVDNGKPLFEDNCKKCHGPEGLGINFQSDAEPEYPASIANEAPVELLSKLRFGQPGIEKMPSGIDNSWTDQNYADAIAYIQTLPTSSPVTEGGRIYDDWMGALGAQAPEGDQPLWKTQTTSQLSGADTYTCAVCHGFDYKGKDGVNAKGTENYTGFPGILAAKTKSAEELKGILSGKTNPDHDFSKYFTGLEMDALVAFLQNGVSDRSAFFNTDGTIKGDATHGKALYGSVCQICHGEDGKTRNFAEEGATEGVYVGTIAVNEPQTMFHVGTVGEPGAQMPAGMNLGWSQQDIADLLVFLQTLPTK